MTDTPTQPDPQADPAPAPNLAILKGITFGLGVLLVLGMVLVGVRMATLGGSEAMPSGDLATAPLPALPPGTVVSVHTVDGALFILLEREGETELLRWSPQAGDDFQMFPTAQP